MSTHKRIDVICIAAALLSLALTVLVMAKKGFTVLSVAAGGTDSGMFTAGDLDADWDISYATKIELSDEGSAISGKGAYV